MPIRKGVHTLSSWKSLFKQIRSYHPEADPTLRLRLEAFFEAHAEALPSDEALAPEAISESLVVLRLDTVSVAAGALANLVAGGDVSLEEVRQEFGDATADLVERVNRLGSLTSQGMVESQPEEFCKMVLAMAQDVRVILVRLALSLHEMRRAVQYPPSEASVRFSREVLEIYTPIAHRLGVHRIKSELEDLAFRLIHPEEHADLARRVQDMRRGGEDVVRKVVAIIEKKLSAYDIPVTRVFGRIKHLYSIWHKLARRETTLDALYDLIAYRIIVQKKSDCYRVLGMIHSEFSPIPGRFKDYIALPKSNGYRSLHTVVFGPFGNRIEIQIRTEKMHRIAESGVAAHWIYKARGISSKKPKAESGYAWLQQLLETHQSADNPVQFLQNVKVDLFPDEVYLFTPQGRIITLPRGATPVDFAYAVHSEVGDHCQGCRINGRMAPLKAPLATGDTVEIITAERQHPNPNWLQFVVTGKAKYRIARWHRKQERTQFIALGREMLERETRKVGHGAKLTEAGLQQAAERLKQPDVEEMLTLVGASKMSAIHVLGAVFPESILKAGRQSHRSLPAAGRKEGVQSLSLPNALSDVVVRAARCCSPIPGDLIVGIVVTGKGITIHQVDCTNLARFADQPERWVEDVEWPQAAGHYHVARVRVIVSHYRKTLAALSHVVQEARGEILKAHIQDRDRSPCSYLLDIEVEGREQLQAMLLKIRALKGVFGAERMHG
ncbi:MAG: bifunctional (p)ppGpp synthetase/guanosine-3',5'-bis(diphosphate) 3'-pyrophosphohydrolase [Magnetococcales bacterium]|nr:bifunctional (p)ppGpp synthetase/guanosine-3',5'-bis(diphosphate) 3'-pyrophosphohydrolase [Magnetococcales bacterium]